jgi:hypothetical protein
MILTWRSLISAALTGALCACAQSATTNTTSVVPEEVAPAPVSHVAYMGFTCTKLDQSQAYIAQEIEQAVRTPGDNTKANIAHLKGESEAVKKAMALKKCSPSADTKRAS